jgi:hypothetical protein
LTSVQKLWCAVVFLHKELPLKTAAEFIQCWSHLQQLYLTSTLNKSCNLGFGLELSFLFGWQCCMALRSRFTSLAAIKKYQSNLHWSSYALTFLIHLTKSFIPWSC